MAILITIKRSGVCVFTELEDHCRERVRQEYANYERAREAAEHAVEVWKSGCVLGPDGSQGYRNALVAEQMALRAYRIALEEFSRPIIEGKTRER